MTYLLGPQENPEILEAEVADKTSSYQAEAEEARAARLAGYKSPLGRLIERLLPRRKERDA